MWSSKQPQNDLPGSSSSQSSSFSPTPINSTPVNRTSAPTARTLACLGESLDIKGKISGQEDLQIDGNVEGPVSLNGQRLTVGRTGRLVSEITARDVIVYGKVTGNLQARDRVEIKKDGSVIGDITTSRISIEDGAYYKGRIEIEHKQPYVEETETDTASIPVSAN